MFLHEIGTPGTHDGLELRTVAERVGIAVCAGGKSEHDAHIIGSCFVDRPAGREVVCVTRAGILPGRHEVRPSPALVHIAARMI